GALRKRCSSTSEAATSVHCRCERDPRPSASIDPASRCKAPQRSTFPTSALLCSRRSILARHCVAATEMSIPAPLVRLKADSGRTPHTHRRAEGDVMAKYTLVLRDSGSAFTSMSPNEIQAIIARYTNWAQPLRDSGKIVASQKLREGSGRVL